jgi:TRAP-type C4-dicarboxylate transport system permease small subunit
LKKLLSALCGTLAAAALFAIMVLTLVDVAGRKFFSASVPGSLELTELLMVAVIFAGLPLVSLQGEHVVFDSLDSRLSPALRRAQQFIVDALCAAALGGLAWLMWLKAGQMASYGDITAQLKLPVGPFVYAMSLLCALTAAVHGALSLWPAREPHTALGGG